MLAQAAVVTLADMACAHELPLVQPPGSRRNPRIDEVGRDVSYVGAELSASVDSGTGRVTSGEPKRESGMYIRKSASSVTGAEQAAFVAAVLELKSKPSLLHPADQTQHRYDDFVEVHLNAMAIMNSTPPGQSWGHMASAFGPWHRVLLHHFETELQQIDSSVTLPYWDWTVDHDQASPIWNPALLGGNGQQGGLVPDGPFSEAHGAWPLRVLDDPTNDEPFLTRFMGQAPDAQSLATTAMVTSALGRHPMTPPRGKT
jgi:hypothetical protein